MLHVLLESSGRSRRSGGGAWTAASVIVHAMIIAGAVGLTAREAVPRVPSVPQDTIVIYVPPPDVARTPDDYLRPEPGPIVDRQWFPDLPVLRAPDITPIGIQPMTGQIAVEPSEFGRGGPFGNVVEPHGPLPGGIYTPATVDRTVVPRADNPRPEFPASLRAAGIEGDVLVQFVVDTVGRVDAASITIVRANHALFGEAVKRWLTRTRYTPAEAGGRRVAQLVQQQVGFALRP